MLKNFWIHAFELPGPEEWRVVEVLAEVLEVDMVGNCDAWSVGCLELRIGPVASEAFGLCRREWQEVNFLIVGGAFSVEENAINLVSTLKKEGFNATLHFQNHNKLHLVALGEFETEVEARSALEKARKAGRKASWLKRL